MRRTEGSARRTSSRSRALPPRRSAALTFQAARPSVPFRKPRPERRAVRTQRGGEGVGPGGVLRDRGRGLCATGSGSPGEGARACSANTAAQPRRARRGSGRVLHALGAGPLAVVSNCGGGERFGSRIQRAGPARSLARLALKLRGRQGKAVLGAEPGRGLCAAAAAMVISVSASSPAHLDLAGRFRGAGIFELDFI